MVNTFQFRRMVKFRQFQHCAQFHFDISLPIAPYLRSDVRRANCVFCPCPAVASHELDHMLFFNNAHCPLPSPTTTVPTRDAQQPATRKFPADRPHSSSQSPVSLAVRRLSPKAVIVSVRNGIIFALLSSAPTAPDEPGQDK